jgi:sulfoxide reductase catalytic subunit YedY
MLIRKAPDVQPADITPKEVYLNRRAFMAGIGAAGTSLLAGGSVPGLGSASGAPASAKLAYVASSLSTSGEKPTASKIVISYNNFYEFGINKDEPAKKAAGFTTEGWRISIEGLIKKPGVYDVTGIVKMHPSLEERIYRFRCVEAWSMVIPWIGIPLSSVIKAVAPESRARYVAFETLHDPTRMPGQRDAVLPWPYIEGLRLDEAMHPLTILAVGMYGESLPNQSGAPIRLVVPWKYGFKSIKSIVKIRFVEERPVCTWNAANPKEYGFYANVNPQVNHPRWSQAQERRIGELLRRPTMMFNGYEDQVGSLYAGMDLRRNY